MADFPYSVIMVPVDGSASANRAAAFATRLAERVAADIELVHAFPSSATELVHLLGVEPVPAGVIRAAEQDIERALEESSSKAFEAAREAIGAALRPIRTAVVRGHPAEAILEYVGEHPEAMIVMGTRGLSPMREMLLGSVSDRVLRSAPCPVTLVR